MSSATRTIYHVKTGAATIYAVDAHAALSNHPKEWRHTPKFTSEERAEFLKREVDEARQQAEFTRDPKDIAKADKLERENAALAEKLEQDGPAPEPLVEIPDDWQDRKPSERIALAVKLGSERKGLTAAKADEVIEDEVERRKVEADEPSVVVYPNSDPKKPDAH